MTTLKRLLLATTILTAAGNWEATATAQDAARMILAQQASPEPEKKPEGTPPAKPAPAGKPAPAPATKPAPAQPQRPAAPTRPTPPATQQAPAPGAAQPRKPDQAPPAVRQPQPPATQQPVQRRELPQRPVDRTPPAPPSQVQPSQAPAQAAPGTPPPPPPRDGVAPGSPAPRVQPQQPSSVPTPPPSAIQDRRAPSGQQSAPAPAPQAPAAQPAPQQSQTPATQPGRPATAAQPRRIEDLRQERREEKRDGRTVIQEGDRTIIRQGDRTIIRRDEADRFRSRGGRDARVERRGNETFTISVRPGGVQIVTVTDSDGRLIRRARRDARGREVVIIDNRSRGPRRAGGFFVQLPPPVIRIPRERYIVEANDADETLIYETLIAPPVERIERGYTLDEVRYSPQLRDRMRRVDVDSVTFDTGSWDVTQDQVSRLAPIADAIRRAIERNPNEVFLIEGHTDAVGPDIDNLSLSDRRAESVANLLTEEFGIPPENLTTQGYGEEYLKIPTDGPERQNRRVTVRRITPLLTGQNQPGGPPPR